MSHILENEHHKRNSTSISSTTILHSSQNQSLIMTRSSVSKFAKSGSDRREEVFTTKISSTAQKLLSEKILEMELIINLLANRDQHPASQLLVKLQELQKLVTP